MSGRLLDYSAHTEATSAQNSMVVTFPASRASTNLGIGEHGIVIAPWAGNKICESLIDDRSKGAKVGRRWGVQIRKARTASIPRGILM